MSPRGSSLIAALAVALSASAARGQDQAAAAEALFKEGRELASHGRFEEACPKFAASQKLDPGYGTLYNLGECLARIGKTASAWAALQEAAALAKTTGQEEREAKALRAAAAVEPKLERLTVVVRSPPPGLVVKRDGAVLDAAAWGSALPVDPGRHLVEAGAPGKKPFSGTILAGGPGTSVTLEIPVLEDAPPPVPTAPGVRPVPDGGAGRRIAAYVTGGLGVAGLAVGAAMGASAKSKWDEAQTKDCRTSTLCSTAGVNLVSGAKTAADVSTAAFVGGGVLLATGVVLLVTALPPSRATAKLTILPVLGPNRSGLQLGGSF
jgi:hypothetical protein